MSPAELASMVGAPVAAVILMLMALERLVSSIRRRNNKGNPHNLLGKLTSIEKVLTGIKEDTTAIHGRTEDIWKKVNK